MAVHPRSLILIAALGLSPVLCAHGGQYRGPWGTPPGAPPGPTTGGPAVPGPTTGSPQTGGMPDLTSWTIWWEFNKDPLLQLRAAIHDVGPVSGSDDFFMGMGRGRKLPRDTLAPSEREKREKIVPALHRALQGTGNRDIVTACLIALAKVGLDAEGIELVPTFTGYLRSDNQEIRETAAVCLGIAGQPAALPVLEALVTDSIEGRRMVDRAEVGDRTRAFSAYGLGLLAGRSGDVDVKQKAHDLLAPLLAVRGTKDRDLQVAAVHGIGLLAPDLAAGGAHRRLLWQALQTLWAYYDRDLGKGDQLLQAHAPIAVARLLGRGNSSEHQRAKGRLLEELSGKQRRNNTIYQSAVLALGAMCLPREEYAEDALCSEALLRYYREGIDQQTRFFSLVALGRIGGSWCRSELITAFDGGNKATEKPWAALGLGLIGRDRYAGGSSMEVDLEIGRTLHKGLGEVENKDTKAALALALGLCGYQAAAEDLRRQVVEHDREDQLAGYTCVGLALMDDDMAVGMLRDLIHRSVRRPFLLQQASVALGRLGDKSITPVLQDIMAKNENVAALAAVAGALGFIGDRRSIDPLIGMLRDEELTKLARAFVAAALGGVGDKDPLPWNTPLSVGANYRANVDTLVNGRTGVLDIL